MFKRPGVLAVLPALFLAGSVLAQQAQPQYPVLDQVAQKVITKYQTSTCVQLATEKSEKPAGEKAEMEQRVVQLLKNDAQMRKVFLDKVAAPIANKLFECGMIP